MDYKDLMYRIIVNNKSEFKNVTGGYSSCSNYPQAIEMTYEDLIKLLKDKFSLNETKEISKDLPGLIARWKLNGDFKDSLGNYDCTGHNIKFENDYVNYSNSPKNSYIKTNEKIRRNGSKEITICAVVKIPINSNVYGSLWQLSPDDNDSTGNSRQPALWTVQNENNKFHSKNDGESTHNLGTETTKSSSTYNKWLHVVQQVKGREILMYIDGVLFDKFTASEDLKYNDGYFYIGDQWHYKFHFIKNVEIYNRALSSNEISILSKSI